MAEHKSPLRSYREVERLSLEGLGALFGVHKTTVMRWEDGAIPAERVIEIESKTGIPRHRLRPDLYARPARLAEAG